MKALIVLSIIGMILLTACSVDTSSPDVQSFVFEWSEGSCMQDSDCTAFDYGCGGGHTICTNNTEKWADMLSTCDIVEDHPSKEGRTCECHEETHKCGWAS